MSDDDITPPRGVQLDDASRVLADHALAHNGVAARLGEAASVVARLRGAERSAFLAAIADKLGELGDLDHEARREVLRMSMMANGAYGPGKP